MGPAVAPAGMAAVPVGGGSSAPGHTDGATAVQNSPSTLLLTACAGQNSPCSPKMAQFDAFCPCRANFLPLSPPTSHAGRTFSCARHDNIATLKPTTPLLTHNTGPLKPTTPLRPKNAPQSPISPPQRRWRFQSHAGTSEQRRQGFQLRLSLREQRRQGFHTTGTPGLQGLTAIPAGDDDTTASQISHAIRLEEVSTISENVAIPTLLIHDSKEPRGNCMRNCWLTAIAGFQGDISSRRSAPRHHWHGGHRR